jgi:nucleoside 2-deoxyribosyltransferase
MNLIKTVYIASPVFNPKEREENQEIDRALRQAGFDTFLPQRDGFLFVELVAELQRQGCAHEEAEKIALNLIAHLDVYQVCEICDATVLNLNGRVPDEGAVSEGALAFRSGRPLVIYKQDARSLIAGKDNPLVVGLTHFEVAESVAEIPVKLRQIEGQAESSYSKMIKIAGLLFAEYNPADKKISELAQKGKKLFS